MQQPRALYIESIIMYCPHVCSGQTDQGQVRILAIGTFHFLYNHSARGGGLNQDPKRLEGIEVHPALAEELIQTPPTERSSRLI